MTLTTHKSAEQLQDEKQLILNAQDNPKAFEPLYNAYFESIFRFVYQRVDQKTEASDITQQVFLKALCSLKSFRFKDVPFSAWLYRIAINEISSYYSLSKKNRIVSADITKLLNIVEDTGSENKEEQLERITRCLTTLNSNDLLLIEMRFFEQISFKEIGEILKITENNAKVKLYRVVDKIKEKVNAFTI